MARGDQVPLSHRRVLAELTACRTPALGTHQTYCDQCGEIFTTYNSCRNRHCVTCGGPARARWLDRLRCDLLPVVSFHVVFTLPGELRRLVLANQYELYGLLFRAAWQTLKQLAADPKHLGGKIGAVMVLHTWKQDLLPHPHLHCVIPGGGLSPEGKWVGSRSSRYLVPHQALSNLFRGKFLAGLKRLHQQGKLALAGDLVALSDRRALQQWLAPLYQTKWEVYCQEPPEDCDDPDAMLKYLARYVVGGVISDQRLISHANGQVTFWARQGKGKKRYPKPLPLPGVEFVRRFLMHVLPRGFHRVRYYGLLSNSNREELALCRRLVTEHDTARTPQCEPPDPKSSDQPPSCPSCGEGVLLLWDREDPPSWRELLARSPYIKGKCSPQPRPRTARADYLDSS